MKAAGVVPSNYTLSILVKLLGRGRRLKLAFDIIAQFRAAYDVRPNVQVFTCLMQACLMNRQTERALEVHDEMVRELGTQPDEKAYSVLLGGCTKAGALEVALRVGRCAFRLPGHGLAEPVALRGPPSGVERRLVEELGQALRGARGLSTSTMAVFEELLEVARSRPDSGKGKGKGCAETG